MRLMVIASGYKNYSCRFLRDDDDFSSKNGNVSGGNLILCNFGQFADAAQCIIEELIVLPIQLIAYGRET
jgi:hypothetical protein